MRRGLLVWPLLLTLWAGTAAAQAQMTVLVDLLRLTELANILREEGLVSARDLNEELLNGEGAAGWQVQIEAIYDPARIVESVRRGLNQTLNAQTLESAVDFFASDLGSRIVTLENTARRAIMDPDVESAARLRVAEARDTNDPRLAMIEGFVASSDMIERNVVTTMNSNFQYLRGLSDGDAIAMSEAEMLADVAGQEENIRDDTTGWLLGYMLMAYSPLNDAELQRYIEFSATPAGQALNSGLFDGFGRAYEDISYALGRAAALNMTAQEL